MVSLIAFTMLAFAFPGLLSDAVVINEVFYDSEGKDSGCFLELVGIPGTKLDGYFLIGVDGDTGREYSLIDLAGNTIPSDGFFVIAQDESVPNFDKIDPKADYQNAPDNIELWYIDRKIDSVGYGDFSDAVFTGEGKPTFDLSGYSIGRRPDAFDTNDNSVDFVGFAIPSPGTSNLPGASVSSKNRLLFRWGFIKNMMWNTR